MRQLQLRSRQFGQAMEDAPMTGQMIHRNGQQKATQGSYRCLAEYAQNGYRQPLITTRLACMNVST